MNKGHLVLLNWFENAIFHGNCQGLLSAYQSHIAKQNSDNCSSQDPLNVQQQQKPMGELEVIFRDTLSIILTLLPKTQSKLPS